MGAAMRRTGGAARRAGSRFAPRVRHAARKHSVHAVEAGGAAWSAGAILGNGNQFMSGGNSVIGQIRSGNLSGIPGAISSTYTELKSPGSMTRNGAIGGAVVYAIGRGVRALAPSIARIHITLGKWRISAA